VKRVRVLVANRPRLMRELVREVIADQPDIEIVGELSDENDLLQAVEDARPDIVIMAMEDIGERNTQCGFLIGRYPQMKILALAPEKNLGLFYWATIEVHSKRLESSEAGILSALRQRSSVVGTVLT
jgi:AmiR/NasT family two-component response regulator